MGPVSVTISHLFCRFLLSELHATSKLLNFHSSQSLGLQRVIKHLCHIHYASSIWAIHLHVTQDFHFLEMVKNQSLWCLEESIIESITLKPVTNLTFSHRHKRTGCNCVVLKPRAVAMAANGVFAFHSPRPLHNRYPGNGGRHKHNGHALLLSQKQTLLMNHLIVLIRS